MRPCLRDGGRWVCVEEEKYQLNVMNKTGAGFFSLSLSLLRSIRKTTGEI
jgi:hypothetical protein